MTLNICFLLFSFPAEIIGILSGFISTLLFNVYQTGGYSEDMIPTVGIFSLDKSLVMILVENVLN